jgi:hypothetical protein
MDNYTIGHPYLGREGVNGFLEIQIESDNLIYAEIGNKAYGMQCSQMDADNVIVEKCRKVANLMREIDKLNRNLNF